MEAIIMGNRVISETVGATAYTTDEQRWAAVARRDCNADGVFYYSVKTTGVYCKPSCASRPALRRNGSGASYASRSLPSAGAGSGKSPTSADGT